ncbi:MAG: hypothetical protein R3335_05615 [Anaerolineales bacterium]|nr:hypothetical protein [Anaerolineales bacterium]
METTPRGPSRFRVGLIGLTCILALSLSIGLVAAAQSGLIRLSPTDILATDCIDCPRFFYQITSRSLQLDQSGLPHIAFGGDHLYYATYNGMDWTVQTADETAGVGSHASLALDPSDIPHISYFDPRSDALKYAVLNGNNWQPQVIDSAGNVGGYTSIATDAAGFPHISYYDWDKSDLKYAHLDATGWHTETVDANGTTGRYTSIALDSSSNPHISYVSGVHLKYAELTPGGWVSETVDLVNSHVDDTSLVIDSNGTPHISYYSDFSGSWVYAFNGPTGWFTETLTGPMFPPVIGDQNSMAIDSDGYPHIAFTGGTGYPDINVIHAYKDAIGWHVETFSDGIVGFAYASLALDSNNDPHISYYSQLSEDSPRTLKYGSDPGGGWQSEPIAEAVIVGPYPAPGVDGSGGLHVSYYDFTSRDLKYAYQDASDWLVETVDSNGNVGWYGSLDVDDNGFPHISYYDLSNADLKYAYKDGSGWHVQTLDSDGGVGGEGSLSLDSAGRPHISYTDGSEDALKYGFLDTGGWVSETVDLTGGNYSSLELDGDEYPHVSYENSNVLMYAYKDSMGWHLETADASGFANESDLAIGSDGTPHISYYDSLDTSLKYATKVTSTWQLEVVSPDGGRFNSLQLDSNDRPHISYYDNTTGDLIYAVLENSTWMIQPVTEIGFISFGTENGHSALLLDEDDQPHFFYMSTVTQDVLWSSFIASVSPGSVALSGAVTGQVGLPYTFTASVLPITTTLPITWVWETTGQTTMTSTGGITGTATYTWSGMGDKLIAVTAMNPVGTVSTTHTISIQAPTFDLYLPILRKND